MPNLKFIDLFCGMGSFHYSFKKIGWTCVMACDNNQNVRETYERNYGILPMGDITEIDPETVPDHDVLCAGFPCQPFSQCGHHRGFADDRGTLFFNIIKIVIHKRPTILIFENVRGLLTHNGGKTFRRMIGELIEIGYRVTHKVLTCSDYGLPQMRKRLFIVGVRNGSRLSSHVNKLLDLDDYKRQCTLEDLLGLPFEKELAYTIRCGGRSSPIQDRHNWDGYIVDGKEYRLTIKDCLKLQGFSPEFELCGSQQSQWKQLGNTIPTVFTSIIGKNIQKYLEKARVENVKPFA